MTIHELEATILQLAVSGKGILAADESQPTISKRFASVQVESTPETRRSYRELLFTTPIEAFISGVILHEETLTQQTQSGILFPKLLLERSIVPGIKVDRGLTRLPNTCEQITQGLDDLADRLATYKQMGARFAKWRMVLACATNLPSDLAIHANAHAMARYAAICQEAGLVPIVEPELLMDGAHSIEHCAAVTELALYNVFDQLQKHKVSLEYILLKPSMIINGNQHAQQASITAVAQATIKVLRRTVPAAVPSINFLSGGQTPEMATAHLNKMNKEGSQPWLLSFSYGRALQDPALKLWKGSAENIKAAQNALYKRARLNAHASKGKYRTLMETESNEPQSIPA
jgi:fructose-bisphosphate aldolase, class I